MSVIKWEDDTYEVIGDSVDKLLSRYDIYQKDSRILILKTLEKKWFKQITFKCWCKRRRHSIYW